MNRRALFTLLPLLALAVAGDVAATTTDPFQVTGFFDQLIDFLTGPFGRAASIFGLIVVGFLWWRSREEEGSKFQGLVNWALGVALVLNAPAIVDLLGFAGATF